MLGYAQLRQTYCEHAPNYLKSQLGICPQCRIIILFDGQIQIIYSFFVKTCEQPRNHFAGVFVSPAGFVYLDTAKVCVNAADLMASVSAAFLDEELSADSITVLVNKTPSLHERRAALKHMLDGCPLGERVKIFCRDSNGSESVPENRFHVLPFQAAKIAAGYSEKCFTEKC